jgi:ATP-binding cassette subfamily B protein
LDSKAEKAIQAELKRIAENRTALTIAHRLSTIVDADEILVLEHGRITERGNFTELIASEGTFARMWRLQQEQAELEPVPSDTRALEVSPPEDTGSALPDDAERVNLPLAG